MWKSLTNPNDSIHNDESFWNDIDLKRGLRAELRKGYKILLSILITLVICLIGLLFALITADLILKKNS